MHRPENALFFVTAAAERDARPGRMYEEMFADMMLGRWHLKPSQWAFLLCASLRAILCTEGDTGMSLQELDFSGSDRVHSGGAIDSMPIQQNKGAFCFTRWLHRLDIPCLHRPSPDLVHAVERIDPLSYATGCDRLVWARKGEGWTPHGAAEIDSQVKAKLATLQHSGKGGKRKRKDTIPGGQQLAEVTESVHALLNRFGRDRHRADEAFRGHAFCEVQGCDVAATPVSVMPVFECGRDGGIKNWVLGPNSQSDQVSTAMQEFAGTQGALISNYYQLRLNLLINPNSTDDGLP